jgi:hypothetical protein
VPSWTVSNKYVKAKGKKSLAFFYFGTPPSTPLEIDVPLLTGPAMLPEKKKFLMGLTILFESIIY